MNYSGPSLIMETLLMETPALAPGVPDITHGCRLGGPCSGAGWGARAAVKLAVTVGVDIIPTVDRIPTFARKAPFASPSFRRLFTPFFYFDLHETSYMAAHDIV